MTQPTCSFLIPKATSRILCSRFQTRLNKRKVIPVHLDLIDLLSKLVEIGLRIVDLHVKDQNGFGDDDLLLFLRRGGWLGSLLLLSGGVTTEQVEFLFLLSLLLGFLLGLCWLMWCLVLGISLATPALLDGRCEELDEEEPVVEVGVSLAIGDICDINKCYP